ncbi:uncharacterized protein LOC107483805 isoform X3 [Arachis duranensis]|uniref:Uncharacterized protein LOC107483805 isoform X3 n=1 Tax=Arachis duranensis TaxID=130453 RepID=A0A6P5NIW8_ARADU|nr:uncharacterized protein LOC107483805 isoform X3 [Arachis duranensis]
MSHAREPSSSKVKDARERGRSRAAAAIQPASPLLSLSLPPQARRRHKLITLCHRRKLVFLLRPSTPPRRELVSGQVQCVGCLLKKILQVIELRVSHQAESIKNGIEMHMSSIAEKVLSFQMVKWLKQKFSSD